MELAGAGGKWQTINERKDPTVIRQKNHALFQWHQKLAQKVYELVAQVYNQEPLDFPIILSEKDW